MLFTTHLCAGALLGRRLQPPAAFAVGLLSHVAMDAVPHWGNPDADVFLRVARRDGLMALGVAAVVLTAAKPGARLSTAAGLAGAGVLDLDKPGRHFFGASPFPAGVDAWHARIQRGRETPRRWPIDVSVAALALAVLLRRRGRT